MIGVNTLFKKTENYSSQYFIKKIIILMIFTVMFLSGCGGSESSSTNTAPNIGESVGPISAAEFASVTPPSYRQFMIIYEDIVSTEPHLLQDETALARKIFDKVKEESTVNSRTNEKEISSRSIFDLAEILTVEEWKIIILNPIDGYNSVVTVEMSLNSAKENYPCDKGFSFENTKADAFRHAFWNALMTKYSNFDFADKFSTAHESGSTTENATLMDLHNNKIGRELAKKYPSATEAQLIELLLQKKYIYIEDMKNIPDDTDGLVYFENKEKYDGTMTGYITNPDSGGPWDATVDLNQCDNVIRGQYIITRGTSSQKRRYSGTINETDLIMNLDVAYPYEFENPEGLIPCANMKMTLSVSENSLSGNWTSSNCRLGGEVNVSR